MKFVPNAVSQKVGRQMLKGRKASPTLLFGIGVVGVVGSAVLACRATLKLQETLDEVQNDLQATREMAEEHGDPKKDVAFVYVQSVLKVGKLYAPSLVLGAASIGCLTKSHNILNQRNAALTAAYVAVDQAFTEYRTRVIEKYGEEQDQEFRYASEEIELLDENGHISKQRRVSPDAPSMYARFFDEYSRSWSREPEYNLVFLRCQQNYWNDILKARGHVFLNEVYDSLGLDRTTAGAVVGWVVSHDGDNYIDFGLGNDEQRVRDFVNGREGSILLDFNVDGIIYDKIDERKERLSWQS